MEFSSDWVIEFPQLFAERPRCPGRLRAGFGWDRIALKTSGEHAEFRFQGTRRLLRPRDGQKRRFQRAQRAIQPDRGVTSDQKRTEEILERAGMAMFRRHCRLERRSADKTT
jgi:hypothetical protein